MFNTKLFREVHGQIRDAIGAHGPITLQNSTSAAKRVVGQIKTTYGIKENTQAAKSSGPPKGQNERMATTGEIKSEKSRTWRQWAKDLERFE